jgi:hypothetical protein
VSAADYATLKTIGLVGFFAAVSGLVVWRVRAKRARFERVARLALDDSDGPGGDRPAADGRR